VAFLKTDKGKRIYKRRKKLLSEALQIQKNCMGFAIAASADYTK